jgi:uncharacterized protein with HEPN domain
MRKDDLIRLHHMLAAATEAMSFTKNQTRTSLDENRMLTLSIIKELEIVGEAAAKVTQECRVNCPQIPWANIISMRNRLIHAYFDIDLDIVWQTINEDLPPLIGELEKIIPSNNDF